MPKRLVLLFDGTWNTPEDQTNVWRLSQLIASYDAAGIEQRCRYLIGVGTSWHGRLVGGAFGYGLSEIIRGAYAWLCEHYAAGDELFVFGFSRGAYSARSLVGLVRKCGVLRSPDAAQVQSAYALYRRRDDHVDGPAAQQFRASFSHTPRVRFVGVWDTVGSLGVPVTGLKLAPFRAYYRFHDTSLSKIVDYAYHALALDEHREDYAPTLWTETKAGNLEVEQRWFIGAHCNVGGGYRNDPLHVLPLAWLQQKAAAAGLAMREAVRTQGDEWRAAPRDSFGEFMWGLYGRVKRRRFHRPIGAAVKEAIDASVWKRVDAANLEALYRPVALAGIARGTIELRETERRVA